MPMIVFGSPPSPDWIPILGVIANFLAVLVTSSIAIHAIWQNQREKKFARERSVQTAVTFIRSYIATLEDILIKLSIFKSEGISITKMVPALEAGLESALAPINHALARDIPDFELYAFIVRIHMFISSYSGGKFRATVAAYENERDAIDEFIETIDRAIRKSREELDSIVIRIGYTERVTVNALKG